MPNLSKLSETEITKSFYGADKLAETLPPASELAADATCCSSLAGCPKPICVAMTLVSGEARSEKSALEGLPCPEDAADSFASVSLMRL